MNNLTLRIYMAVTSRLSAILDDLKGEGGQDLIEYAVLAGAIGIVAAGILYVAPFSNNFNTFATKIGNCVSFSNAC